MAIAVDNLADAQSLTEIEQEKEEEKERTRSIRRSKSKTPEKDGQVGIGALYSSSTSQTFCTVAPARHVVHQHLLGYQRKVGGDALHIH